MVVIDASILLLFFRPGGVPADDKGRPVDHPKERIEFLIKELEKAGTKIIIPTPALSEILVRAGVAGSQQIVEAINKYAIFRIEPFDTRAAIEVAAMTRAAIDSGKKKRRDSAATWAKIKYDWQIIAISKVNQVTTIYSDDRDIRAMARRAGITVVGLADLPLPPADAQMKLPYDTMQNEKNVGASDEETVDKGDGPPDTAP